MLVFYRYWLCCMRPFFCVYVYVCVFIIHTIKSVREVLEWPATRGADGISCKINVPMKLEILTFTHCSQIISVN